MPPYSILVLSDFPAGLEIYRELFEMDGYRAHTAATLSGACARVLAHAPALVLIDDDPEGMHAVVVAARILLESESSGFPRPTLVAIRGDIFPGEGGALSRFELVVSKPVDFDAFGPLLRKTVTDWLIRAA